MTRGWEEELTRIRDGYVWTVPSRIERILAVRAAGPTEAGQLLSAVHQLAGSAGTFGFSELSQAATRVEEAIRAAPTRSLGAIDEHLAHLQRVDTIEVEVSNDPIQSIEQVKDSRPDVLITDLYMPGCTGFELAALLRQDRSLTYLPIIFLSADARETTHRAALRQDGDAFISKSAGIDFISDVIRMKPQRARRLKASITRDGLTGYWDGTRSWSGFEPTSASTEGSPVRSASR